MSKTHLLCIIFLSSVSHFSTAVCSCSAQISLTRASEQQKAMGAVGGGGLSRPDKLGDLGGGLEGFYLKTPHCPHLGLSSFLTYSLVWFPCKHFQPHVLIPVSVLGHDTQNLHPSVHSAPTQQHAGYSSAQHQQQLSTGKTACDHSARHFVAQAGVDAGVPHSLLKAQPSLSSFSSDSLLLGFHAVYRGFWTAFIILAVTAGLVGGLLLVCGVPFVSARSYKVGGGFLIASGKPTVGIRHTGQKGVCTAYCTQGSGVAPNDGEAHSDVVVPRDAGEELVFWWEQWWIGINVPLLQMEINFYAEPNFRKIVLRPKKPPELGNILFFFYSLVRYPEPFYFSNVCSCIYPRQWSATLFSASVPSYLSLFCPCSARTWRTTMQWKAYPAIQNWRVGF